MNEKILAIIFILITVFAVAIIGLPIVDLCKKYWLGKPKSKDFVSWSDLKERLDKLNKDMESGGGR